MSAPVREDVRRVAVLRANGIGDLVLALPALDALRARFPRAEIVLLGRRSHYELLKDRPSPVDRVEVIPDDAVPGPDAVDHVRRAFLDRVRRESIDLAVQLHGGGRHSNPFVRSLGARQTIGMRTPDAEALDRWIPYVYYQPEITRLLEVVSLAGAAPVGIEPRLAVTEDDLAASHDALEPDGRPLAVLHPGSTDPRRRWPAASFGALADALAARGVRVAVTGSRDERAIVNDVLSSAHPGRAVRVEGRSLPSLVGLLARASVVIANDTGPLHVAGAVGTPTVGIYWCGNLVNYGPLSVDHRRHATSWRLACPACGVDCTTGRCPHDASFVADVTLEEVRAAADDVLGRHGSRSDERAALRTRAADPRRGPSARRPRGQEASSAPPGGTRRTA